VRASVLCELGRKAHEVEEVTLQIRVGDGAVGECVLTVKSCVKCEGEKHMKWKIPPSVCAEDDAMCVRASFVCHL
jgi:hypothetical protein